MEALSRLGGLTHADNLCGRLLRGHKEHVLWFKRDATKKTKNSWICLRSRCPRSGNRFLMESFASAFSHSVDLLRLFWPAKCESNEVFISTCLHGVDSGRGDFLAIRYARCRLPDPDADFSEKAKTLPPLTCSGCREDQVRRGARRAQCRDNGHPRSSRSTLVIRPFAGQQCLGQRTSWIGLSVTLTHDFNKSMRLWVV